MLSNVLATNNTTYCDDREFHCIFSSYSGVSDLLGRSGTAMLLTRLALLVEPQAGMGMTHTRKTCLVRSMRLFRIVGRVGRMLIFCTGAVTHNFQIASERLQYRVKWHVLDHIRPPSTLQIFQYSIESIFAFLTAAHPCTLAV